MPTGPNRSEQTCDRPPLPAFLSHIPPFTNDSGVDYTAMHRRMCMRHRILVASLGVLICCGFAAGKDKKRVLLPDDVLEARTVLVVIDPDAGISPESPNANRAARENVEQALMKWGRFELVTDVSSADLVITVRKGNGKMAQPTIGGIPQNNRPIIFQPTESGGRAGGSRGTPPTSGDPTAPRNSDPIPQVEVGPRDDMFVVYRGKRENALEAASVWRYSGKGALNSPEVPAVEAFHKLIVEAEKQQNSHP